MLSKSLISKLLILLILFILIIFLSIFSIYKEENTADAYVDYGEDSLLVMGAFATYYNYITYNEVIHFSFNCSINFQPFYYMSLSFGNLANEKDCEKVFYLYKIPSSLSFIRTDTYGAISSPLNNNFENYKLDIYIKVAGSWITIYVHYNNHYVGYEGYQLLDNSISFSPDFVTIVFEESNHDLILLEDWQSLPVTTLYVSNRRFESHNYPFLTQDFDDWDTYGYDSGFADGLKEGNKHWDNLLPSIFGSIASFFLILLGGIEIFGTSLLTLIATVGCFILIFTLITKIRG